MLVFRVSYFVDDLFSDGDSYVSSFDTNNASNQIIFKDIKGSILDKISDDFGILVFPSRIQITRIDISIGRLIDLIEIDQSHSVSFKNSQNANISLLNLITTQSTRCFLIEISNIDVSGCHVSIEVDVLQIHGNFNIFPSIDSSDISFLNINPKNTFHYDDQTHSPMIVSNSLIGKIVVMNICVGGLVDDELDISTHDLVKIIDNTIVQTLNILHLDFHDDGTQIGIYIDSTSRLLNIEIEDNTKIKKVPLR
jgi:hypothetical protein